MPRYEFICEKCKKSFGLDIKISDYEKKKFKCPKRPLGGQIEPNSYQKWTSEVQIRGLQIKDQKRPLDHLNSLKIDHFRALSHFKSISITKFLGQFQTKYQWRPCTIIIQFRRLPRVADVSQHREQQGAKCHGTTIKFIAILQLLEWYPLG